MVLEATALGFASALLLRLLYDKLTTKESALASCQELHDQRIGTIEKALTEMRETNKEEHNRLFDKLDELKDLLVNYIAGGGNQCNQ